ncbi:MAG: H-type lectin domain-containing protein [Magnetococcales bacterium]|nr:H-type lectin domain-containing protein [Magnetococcales bacterium]
MSFRLWLSMLLLAAVTGILWLSRDELPGALPDFGQWGRRIALLEQGLAHHSHPTATPRLEGGSVDPLQGEMRLQLQELLAGRRQQRLAVTFARPFAEAPVVMLGLTAFEFGEGHASVEVRAEGITPQGFELVSELAVASRPKRLRVQWLAVGL